MLTEPENDEVAHDPARTDPPVHRIAVTALRSADSPRLEGADIEHARTLAEVESELPPILVHRPSMRVIDGMHRLTAAIMRGAETIDVRFFEGSERDAFVLAVQTNIRHGRPLSPADRAAAAERIMISHPDWSDRAIAAAAGLGTRHVAEIRRRREDSGAGQPVRRRMGRDGRIRPVDFAEGRLRASEVIREQPHASLRQIARQAGVSPTTARDVRNRLRRGEDPVPSMRGPGRRAEPSERDLAPERHVPGQVLVALMRGLASDPTLRLNDSGRDLLRWMQSRVLRPEEWLGIADDVPAHSAHLLAKLARRCASEWLEVTRELQQRSDAA
jgi:ParB-like chromosome segregation protein Spo0J